MALISIPNDVPGYDFVRFSACGEIFPTLASRFIFLSSDALPSNSAEMLSAVTDMLMSAFISATDISMLPLSASMPIDASILR